MLEKRDQLAILYLQGASAYTKINNPQHHQIPTSYDLIMQFDATVSNDET